MKSARQEILDRLKNAIHQTPEKPDSETPVYHSANKPLDLSFQENLEKVNGSTRLFKHRNKLFTELKNYLSKFNADNIICREKEIQEQLRLFDIPFSEDSELPASIEIGITGCEYLVAHTGTVMVSSAQKGGRQLFVYPPIHVIIASRTQIVSYLEDAYKAIQKKYKDNLPSQITLITGPSRTADIEKTLILGAHGPKELNVFIF